MTAETKLDPDVIVLRRVFVAAKSKKKHLKEHLGPWIDGVHDDTRYFQGALSELKKCREEGLIG